MKIAPKYCCPFLAAALSILTVSQAHAELSINASYVDGFGETWDSTKRGVIELAISDWLQHLDSVNPADNDEINISFEFAQNGTGGYLGQWQVYNDNLFAGEDKLPWDNTRHVIRFNTDKMDTSLDNYSWWDPTPLDGSDQIDETWDLLSLTRHEIGHALGFTTAYAYDISTGSEIRPWESLVTDVGGSKIFDAGGINVELTSSLGHLANTGASLNDLQTSDLPNGVRRDISQLDLDMLSLAYGYTLIPEPSALLLSALGSIFFLRRKR